MAEEYWAAIGSSEQFGIGPEPTRQALIEQLGHEEFPGQAFRTGRSKGIDIAALCPDADVLLERIYCDLSDMVGEAADDWVVTKERQDDLTGRLLAVFAEWVRYHELQPAFFEIVDIEEHTVS